MGGEDFFLARIDILALSKLSDTSENVFDTLKELVHSSNDQIKRLNAILGTGLKLEIHPMYGDTIDVYFRAGEYDSDMILMLLEVMAKIQMIALKHRLLTKGAIVKGKLIVDDEIFTGNAMVIAKKLEDDCKHSFIVISEDVVELVKNATEMKYNVPEDALASQESMICPGGYLNYFEICHLDESKENCMIIAQDHKSCLIKTIERYLCIMPDDIEKRCIAFKMYERTLTNHNRVCDKKDLPEFKIMFKKESNKLEIIAE